MKRDTSVVRTLLRAEMVILLRDRRTVLLSIVVPALLFPLLLFGSSVLEAKRKKQLESAEYAFAVTGPEADAARPHVQATLLRSLSERASDSSALRLKEKQVSDAAAALKDHQIDLFIEANRAPAVSATPAPPKARDYRPGESRHERTSVEAPAPGAPVLSVVYRGDSERSARVAPRVIEALRVTRREERAALLATARFPVSADSVARIEEFNVATTGQVAGLTLGRMLTVMLLLFILTSGSVVATDALAGEKERGSLETLLTTAAGRNEIVAAKQLAILAVAVGVTLIQVANILLYVGFKIIPASEGFSAAVTPFSAGLLLLLYLPVAALASAVLLLVSGHARSYKEAQLYFFPVILLGLVPALAPLLPGLRLRSAIALVPVSNVAIAVKEVLTGTYDWLMIAVAVLVNVAAAVWVTRAAARTLSTERLISPAQIDSVDFLGGPALFPRHLLRWFVVMFAVGMGVDLYGAQGDVRVQSFVNLPVVMGGFTLLILRRYRLDWRQTLALRPVKPAIWLATVVAAPAGLLTALGVFRLATLLLPIPPRAVETFGRGLLPDYLTTWQTGFFVCVLPAVFEELMFCGVLLHGAVRRFHPIAAVLIVSAMFGLVHGWLYRLAPATFMGVVLATMTLITGSIFPGMLLHFLNNLISTVIVLNVPALASRASDLLTWESHLLGAGVLGLCVWAFWRNRTPYPGLRWRRPTTAGTEWPPTSSSTGRLQSNSRRGAA